MRENLIILAAGASSRMKQSVGDSMLSEAEVQDANSQSKALIGLGKDNRPLLEYLLLNAKKAGYTNIILVISEQANAFKNLYGNSFEGLRISYAIQFIPEGRQKPLGTADALLQALEQYPYLQNESFTVCNSDNLYSVQAMKALRSTEASNAFISYDREGLDFSLERISKFALAVSDTENYLTTIIEKPSVTEASKYKDNEGKFRVSMNLWKLSGPHIFSHLKECPVHPERNEKELPTAVLNMCNSFPRAVKAIPFKEHVPDLTSKEDISVLKKYLDNHF